jgi:hypothetical protein
MAVQLLPGFADDEQAQRRTKRIYLMGSSLTDSINKEGFQRLAASRGYDRVSGRQLAWRRTGRSDVDPHSWGTILLSRRNREEHAP